MSDQQTSATPVRSTAEIAISQPERYMTQMCKHFQHKLPVTLDERSGHIPFSMGDCSLRAERGKLMLSLEAPDAPRLAQLQDVVARHLMRFAFRETLQIEWSPGPA